MTSFLFLLMWKYLISPLLLKDSFAGYRISSLSFFSLSTLTMSSLPSHLHGFWWEISCWYSWGSLEFVMNCFSIQDSLFVFGFGQFNYVSRQYSEFILLAVCWVSLMYRLILLVKFGEFFFLIKFGKFSPLFHQVFTLPFFLLSFGTCITHIFTYFVMSHRSLRFHSSSFLFVFLHWIIPIDPPSN